MRICHTKGEYKYHVVFSSRSRKLQAVWQLTSALREVFEKLAAQKERRIKEGAFDARSRLT